MIVASESGLMQAVGACELTRLTEVRWSHHKRGRRAEEYYLPQTSHRRPDVICPARTHTVVMHEHTLNIHITALKHNTVEAIHQRP